MTGIQQVYTELLINVRLITIFVRVSADASPNAELLLRHHGAHVELFLGSDHASLELPAKVSSTYPARIPFPPSKGRETSIRLSVDEAWILPVDHDADCIPWPASSLRQLECIHCVRCRSNILSPGVINTWKDLPSEGWAEMMDFWHCHKPDEPQSNDAQTTTALKGYSASNRLTAQLGVGLVDVAHVLVTQSDTRNLKVGANQSPYSQPARSLDARPGNKKEALPDSLQDRGRASDTIAQ